jgi:aspartyl protease family protein
MKRLHSTIFGFAMGLLSPALLSANDNTSVDHPVDYPVAYRDGRLSVDFNDFFLDEALEETSQHTGVVFSINSGISGSIDVQFDDITLEDGIRRLLAGYNYMMLYDKTGDGRKNLSRVMVLSKTSERPLLETSVVTAPQISVTPPEPPLIKPVEVVLKRRGTGHYVSSGAINGQEVEFLLDTGATTMAIPGELANRIGLGYGRATQIDTANGRTTGFETTLYDVSLGNLTLRNVRAIILPGMNLGKRVLLGMNVLEEFDLIKRGDMLIIRPHHKGDGGG